MPSALAGTCTPVVPAWCPSRRRRSTPTAPLRGPHRVGQRLACSADGSGPVPAGIDSWIAKWKVRRDSPDDGAGGEQRRRQTGAVDNGAALDFRYVFAGGWSPDAHGFTTLILRDALEPRGVTLHALSSSPQSPGEPWTLTAALAAFEATLSSLPGDQPLRLIGASVGALLCALYAERHPGSVDSLFLISPTFNLRGCLERAVGGERGLAEWQSLGVARLDGMPVAFDVLEDIDAYSAFPFVRCRAYVAHGTEDGFADLEDSLNWVRNASVNMRRKGQPTDKVAERRLLELDDDHAMAASVPALTGKVIDWHGLRGLEAAPRANLESLRPQDVARGHGHNFEVYRNWLISQGLDPDEDMK